MGRKPNPIILQFFERGPRLADNSNRYPHRCKACGESFPKGRAESLMTHISKKCPAISESDRINACLSLNGLSHHIAAATAASAGNGTGSGGVVGMRGATGRGVQHHGLQQVHRLSGANGIHSLSQTHAHHHHLLAASNGASGASNAAAAAAAAAAVAAAAAAASSSPSSSAVDAAAIQRDWTALETLAEVSRQIDLSEKHDDRAPGSSGGATTNGDGAAKNSASPALGTAATATNDSPSKKSFDASDLIKSDSNMDEDTEIGQQQTATGQQAVDADMLDGVAEQDRITIDQIKRLEEANLSMAAAATAQLNPSLLDPQLRTEDPAGATSSAASQSIGVTKGKRSNSGNIKFAPDANSTPTTASTSAAASTASITPGHIVAETARMTPDEEPMPDAFHSSVDPTTASSQPWGEITYLAENVMPVFPTGDHLPSSPGDPNRISFSMNNPNDSKPKQGRARFNTARRKEVQEVRRIGACIRCRILRKTCSKGSPCDQCRKVLSPRVWRSGCVRTKFTEQLDIFCAGVQVVLAQHRTNQLRDTVDLVNKGLMIEATHFPDNPAGAVTLEVFQSNGPKDPGSVATAAEVAAAAAAAAAAAVVADSSVDGTTPSGVAASDGDVSDGTDGKPVSDAAETAEAAVSAATTATAAVVPKTEAETEAKAEEEAETEVAADAGAADDTAATTPVATPVHPWELDEIVMVDTAKDDVPLKLEYYMRNMLPEFIQREPSLFVRTMLETAQSLAHETNSVLLRKAIELWGLVEILDRERQWQIRVKPVQSDAQNSDSGKEEPRQIRADTDQDMYTTLCLQLTAGAERKAASISHSLLTSMQRLLQDSKTKIDYTMYFTTLILLNCVEKSTWAFKAWDQETLRALWPLERTPQDFAQQGYVIADLLRMLLGIRKALPRTACRAEDGMLITEEDDALMCNFFEAIKLNYNDVVAKHEHPIFSPTDSRSFELLFCSSLLVTLRD